MQKGFTLIETLIVIAILSGITITIFFFGLDVSSFGIFLGDTFSAQQELQQTLLMMSAELRAMGPSANGSYPISNATENSLSFYSDIDSDGDFDFVRYFLDGNTFKKGIIGPTGNPPIYDFEEEIVRELIHDVAIDTGNLFSYFDQNYTGTESALSFPVNVSNIKLVTANIIVDKGTQDNVARIDYSITSMIRNFKTSQ